MKIEITQRDIWLSNIAIVLDNIQKSRKISDDRFITWWQKQKTFFGSTKPFKDTIPHPQNNIYYGGIYPSEDGFWTLTFSNRLKHVLESKNTGQVFIDEHEWKNFNDWLTWNSNE